ncbi:MAG: NUDIX domain-containing protein [Patescibacteria group bacterium]
MQRKQKPNRSRKRRPISNRSNGKRLVKGVVAGGVVFAKIDGELKFLLIQHTYNHQWSLPKGHVEPRETTLDTAVREVEEETSVRTRVIEFLGFTNIWSSHKGYHLLRRFHAYLMEPAGDVTIHHERIDPEEGMVRDARWLTFEEAMEKVKYKNIRPLIKQARARVKELGRG